GTTYGMAEETLAFYIILIPIIIAAGYDAVTGVAIILIGSGIGVLGSTINPFATVIASNAANIPFTDGMMLRMVLLIGGLRSEERRVGECREDAVLLEALSKRGWIV